MFGELTGQKLPPGVSNTSNFFQGKPFSPDFAKIEGEGREVRTEPPNFARRLSTPEKKDLKFSEFKQVADDYYIIVDGREIQKVEGKPVKIPGFENFDFFQRKTDDGKFVITESITGTVLASKPSEREAIDYASEALGKRGEKFFQDAIIKSALNYGITPRYRIEKEGVKDGLEKGKGAIEQFEEELRTGGAARIGNIDYKIHQNDALGYYFSRVENGIRITEGPVGPVRGMGQWSLEEARNRAIQDARSSLGEPGKEPGPAKPETKAPIPETTAAPESKPAAEGKTPNHFLYNVQTGKMEMYFSQDNFRALSDLQKTQLRRYLLWSLRKRRGLARQTRTFSGLDRLPRKSASRN